MQSKLSQIVERMLEDCVDILDFIKTVDSSKGFVTNRMCKKAITQSILNLGENTKLLEKELDLSLTSIDWKGLKGMREIAAHRYHTIDNDIIWEVSTIHIPKIHEFLINLH